MSQDNMVKLQCSECKQIDYYTTRNKKKLSEVKLSLKKHCDKCRKHTLHKEIKK